MRVVPPVENLGDGVWSLPIPIPGSPLGYTYVYALETPRGPVLIDTGWDHDESWQGLVQALEHMGSGAEQVYGAVITHFHPDHSGLIGRLRAASGAWIAMHPADIAMIEHLASFAGDEQIDFETGQLRLAGAPEEEVAEYRALRPRMPAPALPDRRVQDRELLDVPGRRLRAVWTPGHSPGHVCLHLEDGGRLFTGDHVLPRITPHVGLYPFDDTERDPLSGFLESQAAIPLLPSSDSLECLPSHERRFTGLAERSKEIIEHHEERLDTLGGLLDPEPAALWELAARLGWRRPWGEMALFARRMAASETASHLRTLERRGIAERTRGSDGVLRWAATGHGA